MPSSPSSCSPPFPLLSFPFTPPSLPPPFFSSPLPPLFLFLFSLFSLFSYSLPSFPFLPSLPPPSLPSPLPSFLPPFPPLPFSFTPPPSLFPMDCLPIDSYCICTSLFIIPPSPHSLLLVPSIFGGEV